MRLSILILIFFHTGFAFAWEDSDKFHFGILYNYNNKVEIRDINYQVELDHAHKMDLDLPSGGLGLMFEYLYEVNKLDYDWLYPYELKLYLGFGTRIHFEREAKQATFQRRSGAGGVITEPEIPGTKIAPHDVYLNFLSTIEDKFTLLFGVVYTDMRAYYEQVRTTDGSQLATLESDGGDFGYQVAVAFDFGDIRMQLLYHPSKSKVKGTTQTGAGNTEGEIEFDQYLLTLGYVF